jgi:lantibiotic modifying enzyme
MPAAPPQSREHLVRSGADSVFQFLQREAQYGAGGVRWQTLSYTNAPRDDPGFWDGVAGISFFLSEYAAVTGSTAAHSLAAQANRWCLAPERTIDGEDQGLGDSLGRGRAGIGAALLRYAATTGDELARQQAISMGDRILGACNAALSGKPSAAPEGRPRVSAPPSFLWGTAGQGTFLVRLWQASCEERFLAGATRYAERLREERLPAMFGGTWPPAPNDALPHVPAGFAPGLAGIGYFFAVVAAASGDERWRETIAHIAEVLLRASRPERNGLGWPVALDGVMPRMPDPEVTRCQWCIGTPGVGLFHVRAAEALGDRDYLATAQAAGETTFAYGDVRHNPSYCHGLAGNAELFVELYRLTGKHLWLDRAYAFAARAYAYRIAGPTGDAWPADEPGLVAPNFSTGAAGVGHLFLRVLAPNTLPLALG